MDQPLKKICLILWKFTEWGTHSHETADYCINSNERVSIRRRQKNWAKIMHIAYDMSINGLLCYQTISSRGYHYYHWVDTSVSRLLVPEDIITITGSITLLVDY
jgi:hypothetical protein